MANGIVIRMSMLKDNKVLFTIKTCVSRDSQAYNILMDSLDNEKYIDIKLDGEKNEIKNNNDKQ